MPLPGDAEVAIDIAFARSKTDSPRSPSAQMATLGLGSPCSIAALIPSNTTRFSSAARSRSADEGFPVTSSTSAYRSTRSSSVRRNRESRSLIELVKCSRAL